MPVRKIIFMPFVFSFLSLHFLSFSCILQQAIKREQGAINAEIKQRKKLDKVRGKNSDPHSIVSFFLNLIWNLNTCILKCVFINQSRDRGKMPFEGILAEKESEEKHCQEKNIDGLQLPWHGHC